MEAFGVQSHMAEPFWMPGFGASYQRRRGVNEGRPVSERTERARHRLVMSLWCWGLAGLVLWGPKVRATVDPVLIPAGGQWRYWVNRVDSQGPPAGWWLPEFDDSSWLVGRGGFGSGLGDEATVLERTNVVSACFRTAFVVENPSEIRWLVLRAGYQSGLALWLNGTNVYSIGLRQPPSVWDQTPPFYGRWYTREVDLSGFTGILRTGTNILAVQVHSHVTNPAALFWSGELRANVTRGPILSRVQSRTARIGVRTARPATVRVRYGIGDVLDRTATGLGPARDHVVELTNLEPAMEWSYQVVVEGEGAEVALPVEKFRTPPERGRLRFVVVGDSGSGTLPQLQVVSCLSTAAVDLILHTGDLVYPELTRELVDLRCLSVMDPLLRRVPMYPTMGNHDLYNTLYRDLPGTPYLETFDLPTNAVTGTGHFYSFDVGEVHFVSLFAPTLLPFPGTTNFALGPESVQLQWLREDLAASGKPWRVVFLHSPLFTSGGRRYDDMNTNGVPDRLELQGWLLPVLSRYGVRAVFCGHDHVYERFRPVQGVHIWTTGGGGYTLYSPTERDPLSVKFEVRFHHLECEVEDDRLVVVARDRFGAVFDRGEVPRVLPPSVDAGLEGSAGQDPLVIRLEWNSAPGERYRVERAESLEGPFVGVEDLIANDFRTVWSTPLRDNASLSGEGAVFYRVVWLR